MNEFPADLLTYFFEHVNQSRPTAFVQVNGKLRYLEGGGDLGAFGLSEFSVGDRMENQFAFLGGLALPLDHPFVLKSVLLPGGSAADVHVVAAGEGLWVMLMDRQSEQAYQQDLQQRINQLSLAHEMEYGTWPNNLLSSALSRLHIAVLERVDETWYRVIGGISPDFASIYPELLDSPEALEPGAHFPFLGNFLVDAESFWQTQSPGQLKSGIWVPHGVSDDEFYMEASAMCVGERKMLVIHLRHHHSHAEPALIQTAREASLNHSRLVTEVQKKEILLHCIVHDLKQPLTTMAGSFSCLDCYNDEELGPEARDFVRVGLMASQQQNRMIADILDAFSADTQAMGEFDPSGEALPDLAETLQVLRERSLATFSLKDVSIELQLPEHTEQGLTVFAETSRLDRVVANLMENALRYSPQQGAVRVCVEEQGEYLLLSVEDAGPGVPEGVRDRLFDKFSQGGTKAGSTGLGLYFCRIMVERWRGAIGYRDREEGGSCFWLKLRKHPSSIAKNQAITDDQMDRAQEVSST